MPIISLFSESHCHGAEVGHQVAERLELHAVEDEELLAATAERHSIPVEELDRIMHGPRSFFHRWQREKERLVAYLRETLAVRLETGNTLCQGYVAHLIPRSQTHVLRVGLVARIEYREAIAEKDHATSRREIGKNLRKDDKAAEEWVGFLSGLVPWDPTLYDILLPMDSTSVDNAVEIICQNAGKDLFQTSAAANKRIADFQLASRVGITLAENGHDVDVDAAAGVVTITIDQYVMRLKHLEKELKRLAREVPGVRSISTRLGPNFKQPRLYANLDLPQKTLLVDDERDFVQILSERLKTRDIGASLAFDGEQALAMIEQEVPDVMVLDLRMPGIDGMEVLRRVKQSHPETEVIILTGHGSEKDRELALRMGAFAYLQKPADIDILADTMKQAHAKILERKKSNPDPHDEQGGS